MLNGRQTHISDYLIKQLPTATAFINTDFLIVHASDRWVQFYDFPEQKVIGSKLMDLLSSSVQYWRPILESTFSGQPNDIGPFVHIDNNENKNSIKWHTTPWFDKNENVIGAIINRYDQYYEEAGRTRIENRTKNTKITNDIAADINSVQNGKLLKTLIDNLPLNLFVKDLDSKRVLVNNSECDYLGVQFQEEILGKNDFDIYDKNIAQISRDEDLMVMSSLTPILRKETINTKKDGTTTNFLTSKVPWVDEVGAVKGLIGISLDITKFKQKEEELRNLINVTSLQNKKLINFAHIISHNLRSHAANFSMLLDLLIYESDSKEKNRITKMLVNTSDNLLDTLENLNDIIAINNNTNLIVKKVSLNKTVNEVIQSLSEFLKLNKAQIVNTITDDVKVNVVPAYLECILMNFITNGVKYKDPSRDPVLKLSSKFYNDHLILSIEDNGLGIDLKKYGEKLFGMYKTFHNNKDARGMGLYISKNQIEAMNGKVQVQSEVGKGTTFKIYIDAKN